MRKYVIVNMLCNDHGGIGTVMSSIRKFIDKDDPVTIVGMARHEFEQKLGDELYTQLSFDTETDECIRAFKEADVIISQQPMAHLALQKYFPKGKPVIAFVHVDSQRMVGNDSEYGPSFHALNSRDFSADVVIVASEATKASYEKKFPQHKVMTLATNIDINQYDRSEFESTHRNGFIYLGRLEKNVKNVMEFVKMAPYLREKNLHIDIYGRGIHQDEFFTAVEEQGLEDVLRYKGVVDNSEVINLFAQYKAQLSVSTCDCFPTIVLEGYKALTPIIAYNSFPSAVDMIEDKKTGYLIPNGNIRKLVDAMSEVDKQETNILANEIYNYRQKYDITELREQFKKILKACKIDL